MTVGLVSRGSVSLLFALIKGELSSPPAQEGIRRVGAPSTQRPCNGGQGNIRAHPPVEPAREAVPASSTRSATHRGSCSGTTKMPNALGLEHAAIAQQRIEDAGEAPGE